VNPILAIVHEDSHCLVVSKPAGQFTQGVWAPAGEITLETAVRQYLAPGDPATVYLGIVHRLDRVTSGLLVWAKTSKAARRLSSQFERRRVVKEYWAIVEAGGSVSSTQPRDQIWTDWVTRADRNGVVQIVPPRTAGAREAITHVRFETEITIAPNLTWVRLWPQTGRTHQLRVQAARRGIPILGDSAYGSLAPPSLLGSGIALHARALTIFHPITGTELAFAAPLPSAWECNGIVLPDQEPSRSPLIGKASRSTEM
jgi:23S rRNA pseudouridine1911/1915/1917 synthase